MILEGLVTTLSANGTANLAPMGPVVSDHFPNDGRFLLKPFRTAQTFENLKAHPEGVLHFTDDVLLLAQAVLNQARAELVPAKSIRGMRLADCCQYFEFRIETVHDQTERAEMEARIVAQGQVRQHLGFCRARNAVVEAAILSSRVHLLRHTAWDELCRLRILVDKTGGSREREAFSLLSEYVLSELRNR